jgi:hypothetical protein
VLFWVNVCRKLEAENLFEFFSAEMEFCRLVPILPKVTNIGLQILVYKYWFTNIGLQILVYKYWFTNIGLQILVYKYCFTNIGLQICVKLGKWCFVESIPRKNRSARYETLGEQSKTVSEKLRQKKCWIAIKNKQTFYFFKDCPCWERTRDLLIAIIFSSLYH